MPTKQNKLTILYSHGSKDPRWKEEMETLTAPAKGLSENVLTAYMELCSPSLEEIILSKGQDSFSCIDLLPIFLATGKHLKIDIPAQVKELQQKYDIKINLLPPIGHHQLLAEAIKVITAENVKGD
jgi:sirohydrochlorin cobaltochelatase